MLKLCVALNIEYIMKEHCLHILQKLCHTQLHSESVTGILVESSYSVQLCHVRGGGGSMGDA